MSDFVWALDENGNPTKCYAKPENRGLRNCKHKFHAGPEETREEFLKKFEVSSWTHVDNEDEEDAAALLPDYTEKIQELMQEKPFQKYESWQQCFQKNIPDHFNSKDKEGNYIEPVVTTTWGEEYVDPEDPNTICMPVSFEWDGNKQEQIIRIPREDELGQIDINGVKYRNIMQFDKDKAGIVNIESANGRKLTLIRDQRGNAVCVINKETGEATIMGEQVDMNEVEKYFHGEDCNLTDLQKTKLGYAPLAVRDRLAQESLASIVDGPLDEYNDISFRNVIGYEDRVSYTVDKHMRAAGSVFRKRLKKGDQQDIDFPNINDNIKKDLVMNSNVQIADNLNPVAALCQEQSVTFIGAGSYSKTNAPIQCRFPHDSQRGIIDVNNVAASGNVGLTIGSKGIVGPNGTMVADEGRLCGSDFVPYREHTDPNRASMAVSHIKQACPIVGGEDPKTSTKGWDSIKGAKMGVNATVAYISEAGVFEDAVVVSESMAAKMTTVQDKGYKASEPISSMFTVGDEIEAGTKVGGTTIKYGGKLTKVDGNRFTISTTCPATVGDKLAGRHGNKGVISQIRPDSEMPKVDGKTADVIMSPIGVAGRGNLGQIYEVNDGDFNKTREIEYQGRKTRGTGGEQFVMRLNHIAEKSILSNTDKLDASKRYTGRRLGEMESLLMTSDEDRLEVLDYINGQRRQYGGEKIENLLKAMGARLS